MLVGMVFQTLYFLVDLYFVGRLGKSAVAAVSLSGNLMFLVLALTQMLGVGTTALIAHATGRKDRDDARVIFNQSQVLSLAVGLVFFVVMMALRGRFARAQSADPETARLAGEYLAWFIPSLAGQFAMVATGSALRGIGDFKPGMVIQSGTVVVNIVLAPTLMFGWVSGRPLGVAGTAIASFVAVMAGVVALIVYVVRKRGYLQFARREWRPRFAMWARMLKIGLPAGAEFALMGVYMFVVYAITRRFGAGGAGGIRHRSAGDPGGLHARRRARLRGQPGRRAELRRAPARSRARDVPDRRADGDRRDGGPVRDLPRWRRRR